MRRGDRRRVGLAARGGWGDAGVDAGSAPVVDVITGRHFPGGALRLDEVLDTYPVALLADEGGLA